MYNEHLENTTEIDKYKKNWTQLLWGDAKQNTTTLNDAINIRKSNKGITKEIEHISNSNSQRFKERTDAGQENEETKNTAKLYRKSLYRTK